jgi:hypothetical protein
VTWLGQVAYPQVPLTRSPSPTALPVPTPIRPCPLNSQPQALPTPLKECNFLQKTPDKDGLLFHLTIPDKLWFVLPAMLPVFIGPEGPPLAMDHALFPDTSGRTVAVITV